MTLTENKLFKESKTVEGLRKSELNESLPIVIKDLHSVFDGILCKQIYGVAMVSP